jgi:hypothetical protein
MSYLTLASWAILVPECLTQVADEYPNSYGQITNTRHKDGFSSLNWFGLLRDIQLSRSFKTITNVSVVKNLLYSFATSGLRKKLADKLGYYQQIKNLINTRHWKLLRNIHSPVFLWRWTVFLKYQNIYNV